MKKLIIGIISVVFLAGCATTSEKNAYYQALEAKNQAVAESAKARAAATAARMEVFKEAAKSSSGDTVKVAAMMAAAFTEGGVGGSHNDDQTTSPQAPGANTAAWLQAAVGISSVIVQAYGINANKSIQIGAQNAQVATAQSTNNMVTAITNSGFNANTTIAGAGFNSATSIANAGFGAMTSLGTTLGQPSITITGDGNSFATANGGNATNTSTYSQRRCTNGNAGSGAAGGSGAPGGNGSGGGGSGTGGPAGGGAAGGFGGSLGPNNC